MQLQRIIPLLFLFLIAQTASAQCPEDFFAEPVDESCDSWVFEIGSFVEGESVFWDYGDGTSEWGGHFTDHTYSENGLYEVCGYYLSPLCPDTAIFCETIVVECETNPCELDVQALQDGDILYFTPSNFPDNASIWWSVNDENYGPSETFSFNIGDPGTYEICAAYETPECPQGVFWCETWVVEEENPCELDVEFEQEGDTLIFYPYNYPDNATIHWEVNDEQTGTGDLSAISIADPGTYEVCALYETPECPQAVWWCETWTVEGTDCPEEDDFTAEMIEESCDHWIFEIGPGEPGTEVYWIFGDGETEWASNVADHHYEENGEYEVCAVYYSVSCPDSTLYCQTIEVNCEENPCDLDVEMLPDGDSLYVNPSNYPDNADLYWTVNGEGYGTSDFFTWYIGEPGTYEICASYETPECPEGVFWCETWVVEEDNPCELDMEFEQDGDTLIFYPYNYPDNATIGWQVNGEWMGTGDLFSVSIAEPGTYQVCASYETPECPQGVFWCETWTVEEEGCPFEMIIEETEECGCYELALNGQWGAEYIWNLGDTSFTSFSHELVHCYEPGNYTGYVQVLNSNYPECEQEPVVFSVDVPECGDPCELDVEAAQDGDSLYLNPSNYPDNADIWWSVNDENYGPSDFFTFNIGDPGTYEICAAYETPECPEGVFWCETWTVEDDECPFELSVEATEDCGCYELALNGQWGGEYIWNLGDTSFTSSSHEFVHCYEPGNYTGYVQVLNSNYPECEQEPVVFSVEVPECDGDCPTALTYEELECGLYEFTIEGGDEDAEVFWNFGNEAYESDGSPHTQYFEEGTYTVYIIYWDENCQGANYIAELEVPECGDPECTWFEFEVATNAEILPIELDWSMTSQEGFTAGGGSVSLSGDTTTFEGDVCLMAGCYTLTLSSDFPIGLGDFEFDFPIIPGVPINIDWIQDDNPYTLHSQIDLAGDCEWTVGLDEDDFEGAVVYPVPASDLLNITLESDGPTEVRFFDATGKLLKQQTISQSGQLDIAEFSAGYYILQLQRGKSFKTFSVPLLN